MHRCEARQLFAPFRRPASCRYEPHLVPGDEALRDIAGGAAKVRGATAAQYVVVVATELLAEVVQRERVDARVDERHTEADDLEDVPEHVVLAEREVVPQHIDVSRQPAHHEYGDEREDETGDLVARLRLRPDCRRCVAAARDAAGARDERACHQGVEHEDDEHRDGEEDDEVEDGLPAGVRLAPVLRLAHAHSYRLSRRSVRVVLDVRDDGDGHG